MTLSDHEQSVLARMEVAFRADTGRPAAASHPAEVRGRSAVLVALVLFMSGGLALAIGLSLQNRLGTGLGALGFMLVVGAVWCSAIPVARLRRFVTRRVSGGASSRQSP
jgi:hypothetical protein